MNPEVEEQQGAGGVAGKRTPVKKQHILQRRLKDQICESRMLEVLDRQLQGDRALNSNQEEDEEELVCVSTMVAVAPSTAPAEYEQRVCGVLKTVRSMHRQRVSENQSDHSKSIAAAVSSSSGDSPSELSS